ncbi:transposase [Tahibacter amnicola]|uniref:Transposase n=1 Tax=Tahibacter amnicola TaxID=2976241 RepID=A0ABY6B772_9GAMM|nr:transposase [Tahibacter amnicola]UXI65839.1 transposase [Tahibacter amnicola]
MSTPRHLMVPPGVAGDYHCISRCVRNAFLCGKDRLSGRVLDHRKQWIEDRIYALAEIFAIGIHAYAVMSNHVHVVAHVAPEVAMKWSAVEVARRWVALCPVRRGNEIDENGCAERVVHIAADAGRVALYRERLCALPWFMRFLNEPIARRANREDACRGRFWEGRYHCQALLDDAALLACMAYVDLNPIRAGIAKDLSSSSHTSVRRRLRHISSQQLLGPVAGEVDRMLPMRAIEYIRLVDWTGRQRRAGKRGAISQSVPLVLGSLGMTPEGWLAEAFTIGSRYWRAVGSVQALMSKARELGQQWLKGGGQHQRGQRFLPAGAPSHPPLGGSP